MWNLKTNDTNEFIYIDSFFMFKKNFLLRYSCFTMLCYFLLYSKVNQLYVYIYSLFFGFPFHLGHRRALSRVPCAIQQVLISYLLYTQQCIYVNPNLPVHPTSPSLLGVHAFVLYIFVSVSALQIGSSVPVVQIPHICVNIRYLFFSLWLTSLCMTVSAL